MTIQEHRIKLLTLNTWGLWIVSKRRAQRVRELGKYLRTTDVDVVLLQEVWVAKDAEFLMACGRKGQLSHACHFKSGIFGSGLVTLSRFPILELGFHRYSAAGDALALHCGDFLAGKGVGWVRLDVPDSDPITVFNTHLHANYSHKVNSKQQQLITKAAKTRIAVHSDTTTAAALDKDGLRQRKVCHTETTKKEDARVPDSAASHQDGVCPSPLSLQYAVPGDVFASYRTSQILELAQIIRHVGGAVRGPLILGGDLNAKPHTMEMALLRHSIPELQDCWTAVHGVNEEQAGLTCQATGCTFKSTRQVPERIDYLLVSGLQPTSCEVALQMSPAGFSYSDHFAVKATVSLPHQQSSASLLPTNKARDREFRSIGLSHGDHRWCLYNDASQDPRQHLDTGSLDGRTNLEGSALSVEASRRLVAAGLQDMGTAAAGLLLDGIRLTKRQAIQRLSVAALCLLVAYLACGLPHCPPLSRLDMSKLSSSNLSEAFSHYLLWSCASLPGCIPPLIAAVAAAAGAVLVFIGGVACTSQMQALQQSLLLLETVRSQ